MKKQKNRLLLHTCCADCAIKYLTTMKDDYYVTLFYDNSNIHPRTEYLARLDAVKQISAKYQVDLIVSNWSPKAWFKRIGLKGIKNSKDRCPKCWDLRIKNTSEYALNNNYEYFSTTLLTSHYQDTRKIKAICMKYQKKNLKFIEPHKIIDTKTEGFYKQNYCGCVMSLKDRYFEKYINESYNQ